MKRSRIREPFALIRSRFEERGLSHGGAKWHALAPCATCPRLPPLVYLILIWFRYPTRIRRFLTEEKVKFSFDWPYELRKTFFCGSTSQCGIDSSNVGCCCVFFIKYGRWVISYFFFFFLCEFHDEFLWGGYFEGIGGTVWYGDKVSFVVWNFV